MGFKKMQLLSRMWPVQTAAFTWQEGPLRVATSVAARAQRECPLIHVGICGCAPARTPAPCWRTDALPCLLNSVVGVDGSLQVSRGMERVFRYQNRAGTDSQACSKRRIQKESAKSSGSFRPVFLASRGTGLPSAPRRRWRTVRSAPHGDAQHRLPRAAGARSWAPSLILLLDTKAGAARGECLNRAGGAQPRVQPAPVSPQK